MLRVNSPLVSEEPCACAHTCAMLSFRYDTIHRMFLDTPYILKYFKYLRKLLWILKWNWEIIEICLYRMSLNSYYKLWGLAVGTKTVKFCIRTYRFLATKNTTTAHIELTHFCCLVYFVFLLGPLTTMVRCDDQLLQHIHSAYVPCSGTHDYQYLVVQQPPSHNPRQLSSSDSTAVS